MSPVGSVGNIRSNKKFAYTRLISREEEEEKKKEKSVPLFKIFDPLSIYPPPGLFQYTTPPHIQYLC